MRKRNEPGIREPALYCNSVSCFPAERYFARIQRLTCLIKCLELLYLLVA